MRGARPTIHQVRARLVGADCPHLTRNLDRYALREGTYLLLTRLLGGVRAGDVAMDESSAQAMLVAATTGFSAGIEAGYRIALHVDNLRATVDPKTTVRIVPDRIECCRVERRFLDPVHRC